MPRTAGAGDKSQRTRRKQTEAERKQRNERKNAKKKEDQQKEKEDAERARPANTFFMLRSTIQQRSNDNDDNCNGIDNKMMFSPTLFTDCVPRYIPPASLLYFRVRAVYVLFDDMRIVKQKSPYSIKRLGVVQAMFLVKSSMVTILTLLECNGTQNG